MKKLFLSSLVLSGLFVSAAVFADSASLYVSPATGNPAAGTALSASVVVNPAGNKVCVVSGKVSFSNISCSSISVTSGLTAQTSPTCSNPNFVLGIPKCATVLQNLFSITGINGSAGTASISLTGVKVIGAGTDVAFTSQAGSYTVTAAPVQQQTQKTTTKTETTQVAQTTTPVTQTQPAAPATQPSPSIPAGAGAASVSSSFASALGSPVLVGILALILGILGGMWFSETYRKPKTK